MSMRGSNCIIASTVSKQSEHMERGGNGWGLCFFLVNIVLYWPHVLAQEGYLSLACGKNSSFTDTTTGVHWLPDDSYISTGIIWNIGGDLSSTSQKSIFDSLRYFPEGKKNCYTLEVTRGRRYLIRGRHEYMNHNESSRPPEFDVAIDNTIVSSVNTNDGPQLCEVIATAQGPYLSYCLLTRVGFPVITSLQITPLPDSSGYAVDASHGSLTLLSRVDVLQELRYRDGSPAGTPGALDGRLGRWKFVTPNFVLASTNAKSLEFTAASSTQDSFVVFLYFAEQQDRSTTAEDRIVYVSANGTLIDQHQFQDSQPLRFSVAANLTMKISVEAGPETRRELPRVDSFEVYRLIRPTLESTQDSDVRILMSLRKHLNLMKWSGDPCLPVPWDGVTCEIEPTGLFVTGLDLSSQNVTGLVFEDIRRLSHLKHLRVDSNEWSLKILVNENTPSFRNSFLGRKLLEDFAHSPSPTAIPKSKKHNNVLKLVIGVAVGVSCLLILMAIILAVYCCRRRQARLPPPLSPLWTPELSNHGPNYVMRSPFQDPKHLEMLQCNRPQELSLKEVQTVTEKFKVKIGQGGFGAVYYGTLHNGDAVAVKVRSLNSSQGTREFTTELELVQKIKHENLVPLIGFCTEMQQQILIYPYMSNGSLFDRLYDKSLGRKPLDWVTRLNIILGAARGIHFLHTGGDRCIIHRDVKSSNILLDDSMKAKIADFGLSKVSPNEDESLISTEVRGTAEYLDPEYYQTHQLTEMSDVYSFGIVLLETVCGREPLNMNRPHDERSLLEWVRPFIKDANIQQIVDPDIQTYALESLWRVVEIALQSIDPHSSRRPKMSSIVRELEDALIMENNASQYMASIQSLDSLTLVSTIDLKEFKKEPMAYPLTFPFDHVPVFSDM